MRLLVTGATGKVGQNFLTAMLAEERFRDCEIVALCHNRTLDDHERVEIVRGSLTDAEAVSAAMTGVTHVLHAATVKESPDLAMDVGVKGLFNLLEAFRQASGTEQFILISGDCSVGHIFHHYPAPITESSPRMAYPGCYALTKVLEEVMLEQYQVQYDVNGCILRAPWIMEKDDFRYALTFGEEQFGGPLWAELLPQGEIDAHAAEQTVPLLLDTDGAPLRRNFVHVDDLVGAILAVLDNPAAAQQLFNIAMDEPVDYAAVADHLGRTRGYRPVRIATQYFSNWLDNTKARLRLGWRPAVNLEALIERAWNHERSANDPRRIWYPG